MRIHAIEPCGYSGENAKDWANGKFIPAHSYWLASWQNVRHETVTRQVRAYTLGQVILRVYHVKYPNLRPKVGEPLIWQAYRGVVSRTIRYTESVRYFNAECVECIDTRRVVRESVAYLKQVDIAKLDKIQVILREKDSQRDEQRSEAYTILARQYQLARLGNHCPRLQRVCNEKIASLDGNMCVTIGRLAGEE